MFFCLNCEEYFETPRSETTWSYSDYIGHGGGFPETTDSCPLCGSDDIEECRDKCDVCHETVYETITVGNFELCPECRDKLRDIMDKTLSDVVGELDIDSMDAKQLISDFYCDL